MAGAVSSGGKNLRGFFLGLTHRCQNRDTNSRQELLIFIYREINSYDTRKRI